MFFIASVSPIVSTNVDVYLERFLCKCVTPYVHIRLGLELSNCLSQVSASPSLPVYLTLYRPAFCIYDGQIVCKVLDLHYCFPVFQCVKKPSVFTSLRVCK